MKSTMFSDVVFMNECFGNKTGSGLHADFDWKRLEDQCDNILDEYNELIEAIHARDPIKFRDALGDILVFDLGAFQKAGVNAEVDMKEIFRSNMSKFCTNQDEVAQTVAKYQALGLEVYVEGEFPRKCVKSAKMQKDNNGENYPAHKFLKGIRYTPPALIEFNPIYPPEA